MAEVAMLEQALVQQRQREARRWRFLAAFIVLIVITLLLDQPVRPSCRCSMWCRPYGHPPTRTL